MVRWVGTVGSCAGSTGEGSGVVGTVGELVGGREGGEGRVRTCSCSQPSSLTPFGKTGKTAQPRAARAMAEPRAGGAAVRTERGAPPPARRAASLGGAAGGRCRSAHVARGWQAGCAAGGADGWRLCSLTGRCRSRSPRRRTGRGRVGGTVGREGGGGGQRARTLLGGRKRSGEGDRAPGAPGCPGRDVSG